MRREARERATLGRHQRLLRTSEFRAVYAARARASDGCLVVYAKPSGRPVMRLGLSVGRRVGGAIRRNRVKRLLREAFRRARADFPAAYDVVVVAIGSPETFGEADRRLRALVPEAIRRTRERKNAKPKAPDT